MLTLVVACGSTPAPVVAPDPCTDPALDGGTVYDHEATFEGIHFRHSTTDLHMRLGSAALFDAARDGQGGHPAFHSTDGKQPSATFSRELPLLAGDTVSFAVGIGSDGANANDTTGLLARLTRLPSR